MDSQNTLGLPILNLCNENILAGSSSRRILGNDIRLAFEEYGVFMVTNYEKISQTFCNEVFDSIKQLFALPEEMKMKNFNPKLGHGYMGRLSGFLMHEALGIDDPMYIDACKNFTNLMWPDGNDRFCENIHSYANLLVELERVVVKLLFESYGLEKHYESHIASTTYLLRLLTYKNEVGMNTNVGFRGHTDKGFITILHSNEVKGLEFTTKDGNWIPFDPLPSSFVVIAGDVCKAWSNDVIKPSYHRVIVHAYERRYSLGLFAFLRGMIQAPEELVDEQHPLQYKPFDNEEFIKFFYDSTDPNKRELNMLKRFCGV